LALQLAVRHGPQQHRRLWRCPCLQHPSEQISLMAHELTRSHFTQQQVRLLWRARFRCCCHCLVATQEVPVIWHAVTSSANPSGNPQSGFGTTLRPVQVRGIRESLTEQLCALNFTVFGQALGESTGAALFMDDVCALLRHQPAGRKDHLLTDANSDDVGYPNSQRTNLVRLSVVLCYLLR